MSSQGLQHVRTCRHLPNANGHVLQYGWAAATYPLRAPRMRTWASVDQILSPRNTVLTAG